MVLLTSYLHVLLLVVGQTLHKCLESTVMLLITLF